MNQSSEEFSRVLGWKVEEEGKTEWGRAAKRNIHHHSNHSCVPVDYKFKGETGGRGMGEIHPRNTIHVTGDKMEMIRKRNGET
jgi:hypothetical protein